MNIKQNKMKSDAEILNDIEKRARRGKANDREIRLLQEARVVFGWRERSKVYK